MRVPEHFAYAYSGLEVLVQDLSSGEISEEDANDGALRWLREDARGSLTLARSAVLAMRHEAGVRGAEGGAAGARATLRVLELVERRMDPPEDPSEDPHKPPKMPTPARVPEALRRRAPGVRGFRLGRVEVLAEPKPEGWRLSVSHPERFPSWEELMLARGVTRDVGKTFAAILPPASARPGGRGYVVDLVEAGIGPLGERAG